MSYETQDDRIGSKLTFRMKQSIRVQTKVTGFILESIHRHFPKCKQYDNPGGVIYWVRVGIILKSYLFGIMFNIMQTTRKVLLIKMILIKN